MIDLDLIAGFDWDQGDERKSHDKHDVGQGEAEQVFFNQPLLILADERHSQTELRYHALGKSDSGRLLRISFTVRFEDSKIRVISVRDMHRKKRRLMSKKLKTLPHFASEAEERAFWETHDSSDYLDWDKAQSVRLPNLKPSTKSISLRLPVSLLEKIRIAANKKDVPYQSLIKIWLAEKTDASS